MKTNLPDSIKCNGWPFRSLIGCTAIGVSSIVLFVLGFVGALTGIPECWKCMLVVGFLSACILAFVCVIDSLIPGFAKHPQGLSDLWTWLKRLQKPWTKCIALVWSSAIPCSVTMLALGFPAGGPEHRPLIAEQKVYRLTSGRHATVVSRTRYLTVGIAFHGGITCVVVGLNLLVLYKVAFGQMPFSQKTCNKEILENDKASIECESSSEVSLFIDNSMRGGEKSSGE